MADYKEMYQLLFNEMSKAIEIMQSAQCKAEEMYISSPKANLEILDNEHNQ